MGKRAADALAAAVGDHGTVAYFFATPNSYVANQRDHAFLKTITGNYPNIKVIAKQGIADPNRAQDQANAVLLEHPHLSGVYVTFSQPPAEGVLAALHANSNTTTKLVSLDLDELLALDMATAGTRSRSSRTRRTSSARRWRSPRRMGCSARRLRPSSSSRR